MATFGGSGFTGIGVAGRHVSLSVTNDLYTAPGTGFAIVQISVRIAAGTSVNVDIFIVDGGTEHIIRKYTSAGSEVFNPIYVGPGQIVRYKYNGGSGLSGEVSVTGAEFT